MSWLYQPLSKARDEADDDLGNEESKVETAPRIKAFWGTTVSLCTAALLFGVFLGLAIARNGDSNRSTKLVAHPQHDQRCNCGNSAAEAIANGCRFDPYAASWLPEHCWDQELIKIFDSIKEDQAHDLSLYSWSHSSKRLTLSEAGDLAGDPWNITTNRIRTSQSWHYAHCLYLLLKHFRKDVTHLGMSSRYLSQEHAQHCATTLMELVANDPKGHEVTGVSAVYVFNDAI